MTGNDKEVQNYVLSYEVTQTFVDKTLDLLKFLIPYYIEEGKTQLVIAIGCTGGQHRSVTIANELAKLLEKEKFWAILDHRDVYKYLGES